VERVEESEQRVCMYRWGGVDKLGVGKGEVRERMWPR